MKYSAEVGPLSQKTFPFTSILVIKKVIKFQIRKIEIPVNSENGFLQVPAYKY